MTEASREKTSELSSVMLTAIIYKGYTVLIEPPNKSGRLMAVADRKGEEGYIRVTGFSVNDVIQSLAVEVRKDNKQNV